MKNKRYKDIVNQSAGIAAGIGIPGSFFPPLDIAAMSIIWIRMTISLAAESGHRINWFFATKLIYSIVAGSILYVGGSKLINALLHAIPGAGTITAAGANSIFNYVYTNRLGTLLVIQFDSPNFTQKSLFSMTKTIALGVFANISANELTSAYSEMHSTSDIVAGSSEFGSIYSESIASIVGSTPLVSHEVVKSWVNTIVNNSNHPLINVIQNSGTNNAEIFVNSHQWGDELLKYNPQFLNTQYLRHGSDAVVGILAHEVGHSVMGVNPIVHSWTNEMNADYFAGAMLAKLKLNIHGFLNSLSESGFGSATHPNGKTRIYLAIKGYIDNGGKLS